MGYRSDVVNAVAFENREKLLSFLTECRLLDVISTQELATYKIKVFNYKPYNTEKAKIVYVLHGEFEDVKWYEHFEAIKQHEAMRQSANDKGYPTCFIRLGEDTDDTEENVHSGDDFEFGWWDYGYEVIRTLDVCEGDVTISVEDLINSNQAINERSSDDGQQPEANQSQDTASA